MSTSRYPGKNWNNYPRRDYDSRQGSPKRSRAPNVLSPKKQFAKSTSPEEKEAHAQIRTKIFTSALHAYLCGGQIVGFGLKGTDTIIVDYSVQRDAWDSAGRYANTYLQARLGQKGSPFTYGFQPPSPLNPNILSISSQEFGQWFWCWLSANIFTSNGAFEMIYEMLDTKDKKNILAKAKGLYDETKDDAIAIDPGNFANLFKLLKPVAGITPTLLKEYYEKAALGKAESEEFSSVTNAYSPMYQKPKAKVLATKRPNYLTESEED